MSRLPIQRINFTTPPDQRTSLTTEARQLADSFIAGYQPLTEPAYRAAPVGRFVSARLSAEPQEQADVVHDLLAALAEQMMALNQEKQGYLDSFRLDLAGYLDEKQMSKLNRLYTPKKPPQAGIKNYEQRLKTYRQAVRLAQAQLQGLAEQALNLEDFWRLSQAQWMWLLRQNLGKVDNMSELVAVYKNYHHSLAPLMRRLRRTDGLIDQVVYQLYGLTEEEIAIIEGEEA